MVACQDCRHFERSALGNCRHPEVATEVIRDYVTGTSSPRIVSVTEARVNEDLCGLEAMRFQPKPKESA